MITNLCDTIFDVMIGSDVNFDFTESDTNKNTSDLLDVLLAPRHPTQSCTTLIDYVLFNVIEYCV